MKYLHVGSGPHYYAHPDWVNLDLNNHPTFDIENGGKGQPDVQGSVFDMHMFEDDTFDGLYCGHLLEHLSIFKAPEAVREMRRVCKEGAVLCFVGPCIEKARSTRQPQWLLDEIPRGWNAEDDPDGFPHLWTATTELTRLVLVEGGLSDIREVSITEIKLPEWPNFADADPGTGAGMWQVAFLARK